MLRSCGMVKQTAVAKGGYSAKFVRPTRCFVFRIASKTLSWVSQPPYTPQQPACKKRSRQTCVSGRAASSQVVGAKQLQPDLARAVWQANHGELALGPWMRLGVGHKLHPLMKRKSFGSFPAINDVDV